MRCGYLRFLPVVMVGLAAPAIAQVVQITRDEPSDFAVEWQGLAWNEPLIVAANGSNWTFTLITRRPDPPIGWDLQYRIEHLRPPHGEGANTIVVPPSGPFHFDDSDIGYIGDETIRSGSIAHGMHLDNWTFLLDRSPGNGYSGNLRAHHTPAPGAVAILGLAGLFANRRQRC